MHELVSQLDTAILIKTEQHTFGPLTMTPVLVMCHGMKWAPLLDCSKVRCCTAQISSTRARGLEQLLLRVHATGVARLGLVLGSSCNGDSRTDRSTDVVVSIQLLCKFKFRKIKQNWFMNGQNYALGSIITTLDLQFRHFNKFNVVKQIWKPRFICKALG